MTIQTATRDFEKWLARYTPLLKKDLALKHRAMADAEFPFFRATFYRWMQLWPKICGPLTKAPRVLAVGDLHIENFGTWRDSEGRLIWGINDFDEVYTLPYTIDLVRLAASALLAIQADHLSISPKTACRCILEGYQSSLEAGGQAVVIGEQNTWFAPLALQGPRHPVQFWQHMRQLPACSVPKVPATAIRNMMPSLNGGCRFVRRVAGLGSLGKMRYVGLVDWQGGLIAREAKFLTPSACLWVAGENSDDIFYQDILERAVRCSDPWVRVHGSWLLRRLAPDCNRIELAALIRVSDQERLLHAMGWETANIHLGTPKAAAKIRHDLKRRGKWLRRNARDMLDALGEDWQVWKKVQR